MLEVSFPQISHQEADHVRLFTQRAGDFARTRAHAQMVCRTHAADRHVHLQQRSLRKELECRFGTPMGVGDTALLLLIGYNIEISFMFAMMGVVVCLTLPKDPKAKILGVNNRVVMAVIYTTLAVIIECFLNYAGLLTWEYPWWSRSFPYLVWLIGYLPFFTMAFVVHDMKQMKNKLITLGIIFGVDILALVVFGLMGWM